MENNKQGNGNTLYLECYSGISGDMTVAALLDLGADKDVLLDGLKSLNVDGYQIEISRTEKCSIDACDFNVILEREIEEEGHGHHHGDHGHHGHQGRHDGHGSHGDHGHHHHHGNEDEQGTGEHHEHCHQDHDQDHTHDHDHSHEQNHTHDHDHTHGHIHLGHHDHRNLYDINKIIDSSTISENAKNIAKNVFQIAATAESKAHGKPISEVHFHEVGAVDSIVDIVSAAICLDNLNIKDVIVSELYEGTGHVRCQHGTLPVPVPAVTNIAIDHKLTLHVTPIKSELITPTGAAIVAAIKTKDGLPKKFNILKLGLGAGKREYEQAAMLRAMLIEEVL